MSEQKIIEIEVVRYLPESDTALHSEVYKVPFTDDMSVLQGVQYIKDQGPEGASISGIFCHLAGKFPADGWNVQKVRRLMDGRPEREIKGLADTIPGIEPRWMTTDNNSKYKVYSIPGDLSLGVRVTVHDPRSRPTSSDDFSHLSHRFPTLGKEENDINIPLSPSSYPKYPIKEKEEGNDREESTTQSQEKNDSFSGREDFGKSGKRGNENEPLDMGNPLFPSGKSVGNHGKMGVGPHPRKEDDPGLQAFKAGMKKRHCLKCGRDFSYDLGIHYLDGYMCTSCHFNQTPEPMKHNPQTVLCEEGST